MFSFIYSTFFGNAGILRTIDTATLVLMHIFFANFLILELENMLFMEDYNPIHI